MSFVKIKGERHMGRIAILVGQCMLGFALVACGGGSSGSGGGGTPSSDASTVTPTNIQAINDFEIGSGLVSVSTGRSRRECERG